METTLTRRTWLLPVALALAAVLATPIPTTAHAELASTTPEAGAELDAPPDQVVLIFDGEVDPLASSFVVTDADGVEVGGGEVDLEVAERNELRGDVTIEGPGDYTVAWTVASADGHPAEGAFTFTVTDAEGASEATPDTALAASRTPSPLLPLGLGLVVLATRLGLRRAAPARRR